MPAGKKRKSSAESGSRSGAEPLPAASNPLRDKQLLEATAQAHALALAPGRKLTAMQFCMEVVASLGLDEFAIGQAERIWISAARKAAAVSVVK